ncbi:hypothetical protein [Pantoea sp. y20]
MLVLKLPEHFLTMDLIMVRLGQKCEQVSREWRVHVFRAEQYSIGYASQTGRVNPPHQPLEKVGAKRLNDTARLQDRFGPADVKDDAPVGRALDIPQL